MSVARSDLVGGAVLAAVFLALLAAAELWRRFGSPRPEWTRKLVHLGAGATCLPFPFVIQSPWVVLGLTLPLTVLFAFAGKLGWLKSLHGVERSSRGAEYYPLAIFLTFVLSHERPWLYLAAVLVLAVGDAFAALIGSRYGVVRYEVESSHKSLEGSLVFLVIAFLAIHLPTLLLTDLPRPVTVLAALLVAILVTGFEAISLRGADNLFVPLAVVFILGKITAKPLAEIVFQNLSLVLLCLLIALLIRLFPYFNVGGSIALMLYAYANWSLGSWLWAAPVLAGLLLYLAGLFRLVTPGEGPLFRVRAVARSVLVPFAILIVANTLQRYDFLFGPYLAASATILTLAILSLWSRRPTPLPPPRLLGVAGLTLLATGAVVAIPWLARPATSPLAVAAVYAAVLPAALACRYLAPGLARWGWAAQNFLMILGAAVILVVLQLSAGVQAWPLR